MRSAVTSTADGGGARMSKVACAMLVACLVLGGSACYSAKGYKILLPADYVGWVAIHSRATGAPLLADEGGFAVLDVPESGVVETSSEPRSSPIRNEVYFLVGGKRLPCPYSPRGITIGDSSAEGAAVTWWVFFGPEDAIRTEEAQRKVNGHWIPGRLKDVGSHK
jgi:hypothetical protein